MTAATNTSPSPSPSPSPSLQRIGGVAGLVFVVLVLVPMVLLFVAPVPPVDAVALLGYIGEHKAIYLIQLVCFVGLSVPALLVFVAVATAVRSANPSLAVVGGLLGVISETIALALGSSPQSLHGGLVTLSNSYAAAGTDAQRSELGAAARALIAATNAVSWAGILTAAAILVLSAIMAPTQFGRFVAVLGVVTGLVGIVSEALRPMIGLAYLPFGLLLPTWFGLVGWKLLQARGESDEPGPGPEPGSGPGLQRRQSPAGLSDAGDTSASEPAGEAGPRCPRPPGPQCSSR